MSYNVPDDWNSYYSNCSDCGTRIHASEGGCNCREEVNEMELPELVKRLGIDDATFSTRMEEEFEGDEEAATEVLREELFDETKSEGDYEPDFDEPDDYYDDDPSLDYGNY